MNCSAAGQSARPRHLLFVAASLLAAALLGGATACSTADGARAGHGDTLFVGVAVGLQSPERYVNVFEGVQMALDDLNKAAPAGAPVLALKRAPKTADSPVAIAAAFRDDPSIIGVVGHTESAATIAAAAVYDDREHEGEHALVAVSPTASAAAVTLASTWVFRVCPTASEQARALARYVSDTLRSPRAGVIYRNDPAGKDFLRAFTAELVKRHGLVVERDPFTEEIPEFDAYAKRLGRKGIPTVVMQANAGDERNALRQLRAKGGSPTFVGTNPPEPPDSASAREVRGMRYLMLYSADRPVTDAGSRFAVEFKHRTGRVADHWGALGYDAAALIGNAVQRVGGNRRRVRDWIADVGRGRPSYIGVTGPIKFDDNRNPVDKQVVVMEAGR